jgi:YidC/Oxa1 family membrane protein insertase
MPLTQKSTDSMKKLQELGPQIKKLQEKYKDKPDLIQKETMKLYKENKVNPLGGCLPLILQMPFFFALYSALINSIDLWNAPFMLWIRDLSMPDTVANISGFNLNLLPLMMTITTIIQQKQTMVDSGNQQQKIMMYMMPVILLFVFWTMPSGLVLYWFLQNLYQILHQFIVNKIGKKSRV